MGHNSTEFHLNLLKGKLAQAIIETIFLEFDYQVFPFGYESYLTSIIRDMKRKPSNQPVEKLRSSPDLYIYDRTHNEGYTVEVKALNIPDEAEALIRKDTLDKYMEFWPEAILVIYCEPTMNIYCCPIAAIPTSQLPVKQSPKGTHDNYILNLKQDFSDLPGFFRLIDAYYYDELLEQIKEVVRDFGKISDQEQPESSNGFLAYMWDKTLEKHIRIIMTITPAEPSVASPNYDSNEDDDWDDIDPTTGEPYSHHPGNPHY